MAFDLSAWKARLGQQLQDWKPVCSGWLDKSDFLGYIKFIHLLLLSSPFRKTLDRIKAICGLSCTVVVAVLLAACASRAPTGAPPAETVSLPTETRPTESLPSPTAAVVPATSAPSTPTLEFTAESDVGFCSRVLEGGIGGTTPSPEGGLSVSIDQLIPPAPPPAVKAESRGEDMLVTWQGTGTDVDQFYKVYRLEQGEDCWELIGVVPVEGDNKQGYSFNAPRTEQAKEYQYAVTTVDIYGTESDLSQIAEQEQNP
jgi:hypothetical protein